MSSFVHARVQLSVRLQFAARDILPFGWLLGLVPLLVMGGMIAIDALPPPLAKPLRPSMPEPQTPNSVEPEQQGYSGPTPSPEQMRDIRALLKGQLQYDTIGPELRVSGRAAAVHASFR